MPNKRRRTYQEILGVLKHAEPSLNPDILMIDFEMAFIKAFRREFPDAEISACHLHYGQCIYRQVQQSGKQIKYGNDSDFALVIKMLIALAFVPEDDVIKSYHTHVKSDFFKQYAEDMVEILIYFTNTWIGQPNRRGQREPLFPIAMWNCYNAVINNLPRTNNGTEGWHSAFNGRIEASHTSMGHFINCIKDEQNLTEVMMEQQLAGRTISAKRQRKYAAYDSRLTQIVNNYDTNS